MERPLFTADEASGYQMTGDETTANGASGYDTHQLAVSQRNCDLWYR